jgi:hypothetical protein
MTGWELIGPVIGTSTGFSAEASIAMPGETSGRGLTAPRACSTMTAKMTQLNAIRKAVCSLGGLKPRKRPCVRR